jgi:ribosomal protein S18 acetylase RimI-like enzyme
MTELVPLTDLSASQRARLADLHLETMRTLLSDMGSPFVRRYYELACHDPSFIGVCAVDGGDPCGYAVGTPDPGRLFAGLRSPARWFAWHVARLAVVQPAVVMQLAGAAFRSSRHALPPGGVELTYIGVAPAARGSGLGSRLLAEFRRAARAAGHGSIALSVESDNAPAIALYKKAGFHAVDTFREGRFRRHRMECRFDDPLSPGGASP